MKLGVDLTAASTSRTYGADAPLASESSCNQRESRKIAISIVISTRDREQDLSDLLSTLLDQSQSALEVIIVDDSKDDSTANLVSQMTPRFASLGTKLIYRRGNGVGNASDRNMGMNESKGEAVLFLDDDTLLERDVVLGIAEFFRAHPFAVGVQPRIAGFSNFWAKSHFGLRFENLLNRASMLSYHEPNRISVRRSGTVVFPADLTMTIPVQTMMGCSFAVRKSVLANFSFDSNLRQSGVHADLDLTYRLHKKYRGLLFAISTVNVVHNHSNHSRPPPRLLRQMSIIHWFYVFFKDFSGESLLNSLAFLWATEGFLLWTAMASVVNRDWKRLKNTPYLACDYAKPILHLRSIRMGNLEFLLKSEA